MVKEKYGLWLLRLKPIEPTGKLFSTTVEVSIMYDGYIARGAPDLSSALKYLLDHPEGVEIPSGGLEELRKENGDELE